MGGLKLLSVVCGDVMRSHIREEERASEWCACVSAVMMDAGIWRCSWAVMCVVDGKRKTGKCGQNVEFVKYLGAFYIYI